MGWRYQTILLDIDTYPAADAHEARQPIERLKQHDATVGIATSAKTGEVRGLLRATTVSDLIDYTTSSDG